MDALKPRSEPADTTARDVRPPQPPKKRDYFAELPSWDELLGSRHPMERTPKEDDDDE